ncbi:MAG: hypothetical protein M5U07_14775 [Xanthobacteraceae bacterium]|nr:hypothetical protein [Xanthobacteraceae bacterium]
MSKQAALARRGGARLSVRMVVFGTMAALAVLIIGKSGWEAWRSWQVYTRAADQREFDAAANSFVRGIYDILLERLTTNNALQAAPPADAAVLGKIEEYRKSVKAAYEPGLAAIRRFDFPNKQALLQDLEAKNARAEEYRRQADGALKVGRDQRDESLRKTFIPTLTDSVNASLRLWYAALYGTSSGDPELAKLATIKEIGWKMRELSGLERSNVASAIAGGSAIPADRLMINSEHRAGVRTLWNMLQNLTQDARNGSGHPHCDAECPGRLLQGFPGAVGRHAQGGRGREVSDHGRAMGLDHKPPDRFPPRRDARRREGERGADFGGHEPKPFRSFAPISRSSASVCSCSWRPCCWSMRK